MNLPSKAMPIMGATIIDHLPWDFIAPHEKQAYANHGQSLTKLASRGGLAASEALDIVEGRRWASSRPGLDTERQLVNLVRRWRSATICGND